MLVFLTFYSHVNTLASPSMRFSTYSCLENGNKMTFFLWICFVIIFTLPENGEGQLIITATPDSPVCGDDIVLRCQYVVALGSRSTTVKWKKNSTTIISSGSSVDPLKYEESQRSEDSDNFEMVISNFQPGDRDTYSCHYEWFLAVLALSCSEGSESFKMVHVTSTLIGTPSESIRTWDVGRPEECAGGCLLDKACETVFYRKTRFGGTCSTFATNANFIDYTGVDTVIHMRKEKGFVRMSNSLDPSATPSLSDSNCLLVLQYTHLLSNGQLKLSVRRASFFCGYSVVIKCVFQSTFNSSAFRMWRTYIGAMSKGSDYQENLDDVESNVVEMTIRQFNALDRSTYSIQYNYDFARIDISCTYDPGLYKQIENPTPNLFDISTVELSWISEDQEQCLDTCYKNETCGDVFYIQTSVKACVFRPFKSSNSWKNIPMEHVHMKKTSDSTTNMINESTTHIGNITEVLESWIVSSLSECVEKCLEQSSCGEVSYTRAGIQTCAMFADDPDLVNATQVTQYLKAYKRRNRNELVRHWSPNKETGASGAIAEDIEPGTPILRIKTVDPDLDFIGFSLIQTPASPKFTLRGNFDREVLVPQGLDAESVQNFTLNILAMDSLTTMSQMYSIKVTDVNEFAPVFSSNPYTAFVASSTVAGAVILTVTATDLDVSSLVSYSITGGDDLGIFVIDKDTGAITVANPQYIDSATLEHVLAVQASDGLNSATATAVIRVTGDLPPLFKTPRAASGSDKGNVSESAAALTPVLTLEATYHDLYNQTITYGIHSQTPDSPVFRLGGDGNRTLLTPSGLDAEQVQTFQFNFSFTEGTVIVYSDVYTLTILDVNDNNPVFSSPSYKVYITPSIDAERPVLIVTATDRDITSTLTYEVLAGNDQDIFAIEGNTGAVTIKNRDKIDWPTSATYSLIIQVSDGEKVTAVVATIINEGTTEVNENGGDNQTPVVAIAAGVGAGIVVIILIVVLIVVVRRRQASNGKSKSPVLSPRHTDIPATFTDRSSTDGISNDGYVLPRAQGERELPAVPGENGYIEINDLQETPVSQDYLTPVSAGHQSPPGSNVYETLSPDLSGDLGYDSLATQRMGDNRLSGFDYASASEMAMD